MHKVQTRKLKSVLPKGPIRANSNFATCHLQCKRLTGSATPETLRRKAQCFSACTRRASRAKEKVAFVSFKTIDEVIACFDGEEGAANKSELSIHEVYNPSKSKGVKLFVDMEKTQSSNYTHTDIETFARLISGILSDRLQASDWERLDGGDHIFILLR